MKKIHRSIFEYLNDEISLMPIEINGDLYFSQHWDGEIFINFTHCCDCLKANISYKNIK